MRVARNVRPDLVRTLHGGPERVLLMDLNKEDTFV